MFYYLGHRSWGVLSGVFSVIQLACHRGRQCYVWMLWHWRLLQTDWRGEQWPHWTHTSTGYRLLSPLQKKTTTLFWRLFLPVMLNANNSMIIATCVFDVYIHYTLSQFMYFWQKRSMRRTQQLGHFTPCPVPIGQANCQSITKEPFSNFTIRWVQGLSSAKPGVWQ